jgi:predicted DsbA family dithiol-disulfide isomerase
MPRVPAVKSAVIDRVMRAYFEEGCDIGDLEELVQARRRRGPHRE